MATTRPILCDGPGKVNIPGRQADSGDLIFRYQRLKGLASDAVTGFLAELFAGVQAIKIGGAEEHAEARYAALNTTRRQMMIR
ncbi:MAG: hypothetical protein FJW34_07880, partial [Acidobacteria bacterium]|nr:hypothetical protein [Acidobacteriota bacterium]